MSPQNTETFLAPNTGSILTSSKSPLIAEAASALTSNLGKFGTGITMKEPSADSPCLSPTF